MSIYLAQLGILLATATVFLDARVVTGNFWHPRIVGGREIQIEEAAWQVALLLDDRHRCGGAIYSENVIITAAHCVSGIPPQNLTVRAGSTYWHFGGEVRQVVASKVHEYYVHDVETLINGSDIAVLRLDRPLTFGPLVKTIPLAREEPAEGMMVSVSGWGNLGSPQNTYPHHLNGVTIKVLNKKDCVRFPDMMCAYERGKSVCKGDSGGPLVLDDNQLVGIVSCSEYNCRGRTLFASVAYLHDWLLDAIESLSQ